MLPAFPDYQLPVNANRSCGKSPHCIEVRAIPRAWSRLRQPGTVIRSMWLDSGPETSVDGRIVIDPIDFGHLPNGGCPRSTSSWKPSTDPTPALESAFVATPASPGLARTLNALETLPREGTCGGSAAARSKGPFPLCLQRFRGCRGGRLSPPLYSSAGAGYDSRARSLPLPRGPTCGGRL